MKKILNIIYLVLIPTLLSATQNPDSHPLQYILYTKSPYIKIVSSYKEITSTITAIKDWEKTYPIPDDNYLKYFGYGFNKKSLGHLHNSQWAYKILFSLSTLENLKVQRQVDDILYQILSKSGGYLWDSETRRLYTADAWHKRIIEDGWYDGQIVLSQHIVIHFYKESDKHRMITLGMRRFGRSDISIDNAFVADSRRLATLINLVGYALLDEKESTIHLNLDMMSKKYGILTKIKESRFSNHEKDLYLSYKKGKHFDGDPDNSIIQIVFESKGKNIYAGQIAAIEKLFGYKDRVANTNPYNQELKRASQKAREHLPNLKRKFQKGLILNEHLSVKTPFKYDDGREWMWVVVKEWKGKIIRGILNNKPYYIKSLKEGEEVEVSEDDVFDYIFYDSNGKMSGNTTSDIIEKYDR